MNKPAAPWGVFRGVYTEDIYVGEYSIFNCQAYLVVACFDTREDARHVGAAMAAFESTGFSDCTSI